MLFNGVYVLWEDPLVLSCLGWHDRGRFLTLKPKATMLCFPTWLQTWADVPRMVRDLLVGRMRGKSLHFMTSSPEEDRIRRRCGLPGALISQNAYVSERTFAPSRTCSTYDAVYTAQMQPFKRMHLAAEIESLFIVTYGDTLTPDGEYDLHRFCPAIRHADYNRRWVDFSEVNDVYNRSRVGLALSHTEGAMLASVEYMLAGLPMVSTPSRGGRELFFDDRFVLVVEPTARAVAAGVSELIRRDVDPDLVRASTLERVNRHRHALCAYVREVIQKAEATVPSTERLYEWIFGGEDGIKSRYVHSRKFHSMDWM